MEQLSKTAIASGVKPEHIAHLPSRKKTSQKPYQVKWSLIDKNAESTTKHFYTLREAEEFATAILKGAKNYYSGTVFQDIIEGIESPLQRYLVRGLKPKNGKAKFGQSYANTHKAQLQKIADLDIGEGQKLRHKLVTQIHITDVLSVKETLQDLGYADKTIIEYLASFKLFFKLCVRHGYITKHPMEHDTATDGLSRDSENANFLEGYPKQWLQKFIHGTEFDTQEHNFLVWFAANTGLRRGEMRALTWDQVNFGDQLIIVDRTINDKNEITDTKSKKLRKDKNFVDRFVACNDELIRKLKEHKLKNPFGNVFTRNAVAYKPDYFLRSCLKPRIKKFLKHHAEEIANDQQADKINEIQHCTWHDLRHYYASCLILSDGFDGNWDWVAELMGHHSSAFTKKQYAHLVDDQEHKKRLVRKINSVNF